MNTKEEILDKHYQPKMHWKSVNRGNVLQAMEEHTIAYANQDKWISVEKENPIDYEQVLVLLENGEIFKATYCDDTMDLPNYTSEYFKMNKGVKITHWQSLPKAPEK